LPARAGRPLRALRLRSGRSSLEKPSLWLFVWLSQTAPHPPHPALSPRGEGKRHVPERPKTGLPLSPRGEGRVRGRCRIWRTGWSAAEGRSGLGTSFKTPPAAAPQVEDHWSFSGRLAFKRGKYQSAQQSAEPPMVLIQRVRRAGETSGSPRQAEGPSRRTHWFLNRKSGEPSSSGLGGAKARRLARHRRKSPAAAAIS
jgi:hypothetical protein